MSKQVDERVVSMQFDNKNFEKNVSTTMSTLDKFKQKLNLSGASKGLENVNTAAKKVDMTGLANGVETVRTKFSAMEVIGVTALANITNSAVNAGKRMVSALTIDPIKTGFSEYETQINAVQTILANTESKGSTIDDVNKSLEELNKYADQTIYNFTEMTRNIGTFTAAGVDLDTSTNAIKGIANLAAVSGSTSQQASTAMYQLSQAMASGSVKLMDWNSVVNAGMGGQVFQDALKETARVHGVAIDDMIESEGSFRETLKSGWLSTEILTDTLQKFTLTTEGLTEEQIKANREMLKAKGYTDEQIEEIFKLGNTATDAATKVKTFTQLWDVLKESAQSGWAQSWKLIIGDFEEAKALLTPLANFLTGAINKMSDFRNAIIESALGKNFANITDNLKSLFKPITNTADSIKGVVDGLKEYSVIVDEIIGGAWGNGQARWDKLTEAGYDWAHAQNLVNEKLGDSTRHATNYTEAQKAHAEATKELTKADAKSIEHMIALSDAELKLKGLTDEQIASLRELEKISNKLGIPIRELIENIDQIDGRWLLFEGFANIGRSIAGAFSAAKTAWQEIFNPNNESMVEKISNVLFNMIAAFHKFSRSLLLTNPETGKLNENGEKLKRTFKGIFAIFDILTTLIGGPLKIGFKILSKILGAFDLNILDLTAIIGDALVKFRDWIDATLDFTKVFELITPYVKKAVNAVREWVNETKPLEKASEIFSKLGSKVKEAFTKIKDSEFGQVAKNIISGLINGLKDGVPTVAKTIWNIGKTIIEKIKAVLGIHSPSTEFIEIGKNIMAGLIVGIGSIKILSVVSDIASAIGGLGSVLDGVGDVLSGTGKVLSKSASGINKILKSTANVVKSFAKTLGSVGNLINAKALQTVAVSIAILAGSVAVLAMMDPKRVWSAVGVIVVLAGVLGGLMAAIKKLGGDGPKGIKEAITGVKEFGKLATALITIAGSLLLMAISIKILGSMEWSEFGVAAAGMGLCVIFLGAIVAALILMKKFGGKKVIDDLGKTVQSIGTTMILFAIALKIMGSMEWSEFGVAAAGMGLFTVFLAAVAGVTIAMSKWGGKKVIDDFKSTISAISWAMLAFAVSLKIMGSMEWSEFGVAAAGMGIFAVLIIVLAGVMIAVKKFGGKNAVDELGKTILSIAGAMLILAITAKIIAGMEWGGIIKAGVGLAGLSIIIKMLIKAVNLAGLKPEAIGRTLLAVSGAMLILTLTAKIIASMEWGGIAKAAVGLVGLVLIIRMLIQAVKLAGPQAPKIALTLLALSAAVGILAGVAVLLSLVEIGALAKGIIAVGFLRAFMIGLIKATRGATDCMKNLIVLTAAIAVMAAAVIALSFVEPGKLIGATIAIGALMGMFAVMTLASKSATGSMGTLIVMVAAIGLMAGALYLLAQLPVEASLGAAAALSLLMLSLSASLVILSVVGSFASSALMGVLALLTMAVPLLAFVGILALMQNIQNAEKNAMLLVTLMTTMTKCLVAVSLVAPLALLAVGAITALVGVITGFGVLVTAIGALVTKFPQLETFLDTGIPILEKLANGIGSILGNFISGFAVSAMSGLPEMGLLLSQFMMNAMPFIAGAKMIDASTMDGVKALAEVILILTAADILQGLTSWLTGGSSIADFGNEIAAFGPSIRAFADSVAGIDCESVKAAAEAAKALAEMTATIPNEGGVAAWFAGENSISKFAMNLPLLGLGLKLFSDSVTGINADNINAAVSAGKAICEMTDNIPNEGGMVSWFTGDNSIAKFSTQLGDLGTAISDFATNVGDANIDNVNKAVKATKALSELLATDVSKNSKTMEKFGERLSEFGHKFSEFCKKMNNIKDSSITSAIDKFNKLKAMASTLSADSISSLTKFSDTLVEVAENGIKEFVNALNSKTVKANANEAISDLVSDTADKIETKSNKNKFKSAGKYLIEGLAEGIKANKSKATKAAQEVADAVEQIIRSAWEVNSPSKVFYRIALGIGEGMEYALSDSTLGVKNSARDLADTTTKGFGNAISQINDMFNGTFDTQPTIRPVLDLSDVQAGASSIAGLFSGNRTLAVSAPGIGAISASMASRQNGNNDLASAINKLAKSNKSGDTYNFNGFSYEEGSDVADAIQTLVRAAKMEGRT